MSKEELIKKIYDEMLSHESTYYSGYMPIEKYIARRVVEICEEYEKIKVD